MNAVINEQPSTTISHVEMTDPIVVVGNGPVGLQVVSKLLSQLPHKPVVLYGDEEWKPYNRVKLSSLLAGQVKLEGIHHFQEIETHPNVHTRYGCRVTAIDTDNKCITDTDGRQQSYSQLVLCTGSSPHIPSIEGVDKNRIYTFRDMDDAQELMARKMSSRKTVVLGGGLLGLEAARAMQRNGTEVTIVEHLPRLMPKQLDEAAAEQLREHIMGLGIKVMLGNGVKTVLGDEQVEGVRLRDGRELECDTLIIATGIKPNIQLAFDAQLSVGRGIRVNDYMQTSDPFIFAAGECAEHRQEVYGLVAPGIEQANVLVHALANPSNKISYQGSMAATRLKVLGESVFSMGNIADQDVPPDYKILTYQNHDKGQYRKLILKRHRLIGAIVIGDWDELSRVQEALNNQRYLWFWQEKRFIKKGQLWPAASQKSITQWPEGAVVCQCTGVTRGTISEAISLGCQSVASVQQQTGASSVCGSCRPLINELLGSEEKAEKIPYQKTIVGLSLIALALLIAFAMPYITPYASSSSDVFAFGKTLDFIWRDSLVKQITGFTLLGLSLLALLLSLRKRVSGFKWLSFAGWRYFHVLMGALIMLGLWLHTGFRLGYQLNNLLMMTFLIMVGMGILSSLFISYANRFKAQTAMAIKKNLVWGHILVFWPLPVLLSFHIIKSYYF